MVCKNCGTNNSPDSRFCARCGADMSIQYSANDPYAQNQNYYQAPQGQNFNIPPQPGMPQGPMPGKGLAIASMICGIIALVLCCVWYIGAALGILGIIFGGVAKSKGCRSGMATAGIVCGSIGLGIAFFILIIEVVFLGAYNSSYYYF